MSRQYAIRNGLVALLAAWVPGPLAAGEGALLYATHRCAGCHGEAGDAPALPIYPRLRGQGAHYLLAQMRDLRDGRRTNAMSAAMRARVAGVSDADFAAIAEWLAGH
jgi:cytochrome c